MLVERWRLIWYSVIAAILAAFVVYWILPRDFVSEGVLLHLNDGEIREAEAPTVGGLSSLLGKRTSSDDDLISTLTKSRTLQDSLVRVAAGRLRAADTAALAQVVATGLTIEAGEPGSYRVKVIADDPRQAQAVAAAVPEVINSLAARVTSTATQQKVKLLEQQVSYARGQLEAAEAHMLTFQRSKGAPALKEQASQTLLAAAALQEQILQKELALSMLRRAATPDNPEVRFATAELDGLRGQLRRLTSAGDLRGDLFVPVGRSPELTAEATRIMRDYRQSETVYLALLTALAERQVAEQVSVPVVTVLDAPLLPRTPSHVGLPTVMLAALLVGLSVGIVLAFVVDYLLRAQEDARNEYFFRVVRQVRSRIQGGSRLPVVAESPPVVG
jgi:capsular polysaccharide transport system permease protein